MKNRNRLIYMLTIITVIIVYLVIYLFGTSIRKNIYSESEGYANNPQKQPINNIISIPQDIHNLTPTVFLHEDGSNYIDLYNQFPTADEVGMNFQGDKYTHDFKLRFNSYATNVRYTITAIKLDGSDLEDEWAKIYLMKDGKALDSCFRESGRVKTFNEYPKYRNNPNEIILYQSYISPLLAIRGYQDFTLKMWVSEDLTVFNEEYLLRYFKVKIGVYAERTI